jgi:hypothetical protein
MFSAQNNDLLLLQPVLFLASIKGGGLFEKLTVVISEAWRYM